MLRHVLSRVSDIPDYSRRACVESSGRYLTDGTRLFRVVTPFAISETVGLAAAFWPHAWLGLFGHDPQMLSTGTAYLRAVGPTYGFFGLGLSLYFASQGAGRLAWPLIGGLVRLVVAVGGGALVLSLTGSLAGAFAALALALVAYGVIVAGAVGSGVWFRRR